MTGPWTVLREAVQYLRERWVDERSPASLGFDASLGVETARWTLGGYEPTPPARFLAMMEALPVSIDGATFVDVGAGKGRVLILAARYPFARVVGLEQDARLVAIAKRNLRQPDDHRLTADLSVLQADATDAAWPLGPLVVFLYNPFAAEPMRALLEGLEASLQAHPRPCVVGYLNPLYEGVFDQRQWRTTVDVGHGTARWIWVLPPECLTVPSRPRRPPCRAQRD